MKRKQFFYKKEPKLLLSGRGAPAPQRPGASLVKLFASFVHKKKPSFFTFLAPQPGAAKNQLLIILAKLYMVGA